MSEEKQQDLTLHIRDGKLLFWGILTAASVPVLAFLQTFAGDLFFSRISRPDDPFHRAFYQWIRLEEDVEAAKRGQTGPLLRDYHQGKIEKPYAEALLMESAGVQEMDLRKKNILRREIQSILSGTGEKGAGRGR